MRLRRTSACGAAALGMAAGLVALTLPAAAAEDEATRLAEAFCRARLASYEAATEPLLSPSLRDAIVVALDRNQVIAEARPDQKPLFGDGIPYQSFMDAADRCHPGSPVRKGSEVEVPVTYAFDDAPAGGWTDRLVLTPAGEGYLVDDIVFVGSPDGTPPPRLRDTLLGAFDQ